MIQLSSLSKRFGERVLLDAVTWHVGDSDRVGLCGPNGAGKTTLLKILAGLDEADGGSVIRPTALTVGYLPQDGLSHQGRTVFAEASDALRPLLDMKSEMHDLEHRLADATIAASEHDAMLERYSGLQERFRMADGYALDLKVAAILRGLGFSAADFETQAEHLSGGWQMRLALAKLLLQAPGLLLLDEPTNHLDLEARNWLEEYLARYPAAVILVSHDRYFLDAVVGRIADLSLRTITDYHCNYSHYLVQRDERLERLREAKKRQDEEVGRVQEFIDRFRYQATKAAQVQSRIKMLEKVERIEVPPERKRIHFQFPAAAKSGRIVLDLTHACKAYGDKRVLDDITLHIERGDRVALVGPNGAGKSTLMRMFAGVEAPDGGTRTEGHQIVMQYFAQDEATKLDPAATVYETLAEGSPIHMVPAIRNVLGGFLFSGDDVYKKAGVLSGGERTRLAVARMLLRPSNTLVLDEPTNHLDLDSKDVLLDALMDYGGTLLFVSHDRYFVERLATKVIEVGGGKARLYPGTYAEFLWSQANGGATPAASAVRQAPPKPAAARTQLPAAAATSATARSAPTGAAGHEERKREAADKKRRERSFQALEARIAELEGRIADRETEVKSVEAAIAAPGFYADAAAAKPALDRHQALMWEVGDLLCQWEMLQAEAEALRTAGAP
ncbi:MAG: ABC-F family ATP-binding cassette domain-containing protein [Acidobacteria bacterium]|nr:ABC-F family ATP-binding cassette domain-containing protein [Acidobacteriota bacterium]